MQTQEPDGGELRKPVQPSRRGAERDRDTEQRPTGVRDRRKQEGTLVAGASLITLVHWSPGVHSLFVGMLKHQGHRKFKNFSSLSVCVLFDCFMGYVVFGCL